MVPTLQHDPRREENVWLTKLDPGLVYIPTKSFVTARPRGCSNSGLLLDAGKQGFWSRMRVLTFGFGMMVVTRDVSNEWMGHTAWSTRVYRGCQELHLVCPFGPDSSRQLLAVNSIVCCRAVSSVK